MSVIANRVRVVVVVSALALAAGLLMLASLAKPAQAQPQQRVNEVVPIDSAVVNPCTDPEEVVSIEGTQHLIFFTNVDANGGSHSKGQIILQAKGVSDSGAEYVIHSSMISQDNSEPGQGFTFIFTGTTTFVRQGSDTPPDNLLVKETNHVTVNANGELTSVFTEFEAVCPGTAG